jgi:hypothetical protein
MLMFDLDGSETSWLVYADWLEDQGIEAAHIRTPGFVCQWCYDGTGYDHIGPKHYINRVGTQCTDDRGAIGSGYIGEVGSLARYGVGGYNICTDIGGM